jgi:hypothetical protein
VLRDIADERGEINRRKLGWWIRRHAGRIVDGRRFMRGSGNRSAETWKVEATGVSSNSASLSVSQVLSVPVRPIEKSGTTTYTSNAYARASRGD